jgi:hypothetical protein
MDKLTPTQLRDLANIASFTTPHDGRDDVRVAPFALLALWLREEAARREAEAKELGQTNARAADAPRDAAVCNPVGEREGLGSAAASVDGHSTDAEIAEVADSLRASLAAPFRLEVGKSYARRDGTGPVKIVKISEGLIFSARGDDYEHYTPSGKHPYHPTSPNPRDLVALWQAEAQAPEPSIADKCHALAARAVAERNGWPAPQTDAEDEPCLTPEPGAVIWIDGFRYVHQPEAEPQTDGEVRK